MSRRRIIEAAHHGQPSSEFAFSQGVLVGDRLFISGQVSSATGFGAQVDEAFARLIGIVEEAGGEVSDLVTIRIYTTVEEASRPLIDARRRHLREPYPAVTLLRVAGLARPEYLVEIEGEAIIDCR
jgi:enamine deaminase RidA (YjgF/YER057c/UK114 family)